MKQTNAIKVQEFGYSKHKIVRIFLLGVGGMGGILTVEKKASDENYM